MYGTEAFDDAAVAAGEPLGSIKRRKVGLTPFQKGQTGIPHVSAPVTVREAKAISRNKSAEAMRELVALMRDEDPKIRLVAVLAILDRGLGKVREMPDEPPPRPEIDVTKFTDAELAQVNAMLGRALGEDGATVDDVAVDDAMVMAPSDQGFSDDDGEAGMGDAPDDGPVVDVQATSSSTAIVPAEAPTLMWPKRT